MEDVDAPDTRALAGFRSLFDRSFGSVVGLARLLGAEDPEDVAAEAFARLLEGWEQMRSESAGLAYVRTIVVRLVSNQRRHSAVARRHLDRQQTVDQESAEDSMVRRSDDALAAALAALSPSRRAAVVLRYFADLPYEQIGAAMDCRTPTARSHVRRGLADLRAVLSQEGGW